MNNVLLRPATESDAVSVADLFLRSRQELVADAPLAHPDEAVADWITNILIPAGRTTVAVIDNRIVGFLSVSEGEEGSWIDQLYLLPEYVGRKIGSQLLRFALDQLPRPIRLYTFQCNQLARHFYEARGFKPILFSDGSENEEKCPDILYEWRPD